MKSLRIFANRKEALFQFWFAIAGAIFLILALASLQVFGKVNYGGSITSVFLALTFCWLLLQISVSLRRLYRLSKFEGALLELKQDGFIDNWSNPTRFIPWQKVEYSQWTGRGLTTAFRIVLKQKSFLTQFLSMIGLHEFEFPTQYLAIPEKEITQFMLANAPKRIVRM